MSGLMAALVVLFTYFIKIPVPATGGYVHPGDGAIFYAALLCGPYAALIGGLGSMLADLLGGYFVYAAPTFVIKAAMGGIAGPSGAPWPIRCATRWRFRWAQP